MSKTHEQVVDDLNEYFDQKLSDCTKDKERFDVEKSRGMALAYHAVYRSDPYETKAIEESFDLPIYDIDTQQPTDERYCGIVDAVVEKNGKLWFADHKTASRVSPVYWNELKTNPQLTHYLLAARQMGLDVSGFMWDVIVKPGISPTINRDISQKDQKDLAQGSYYGLPFEWDGETKRETPRMFGIRCLSKMLTEPDKYFDRRLISRTDQELLEYNRELCQIVKEQNEVRNNVSLQYRNLKSCTKYNTMCDYHPLCAGEEDLDHTHLYKIKDEMPDEDRKTPSGSISTSRIECYLTCRKKWDYKYNQKIEKNIDVYRDSLHIGSLVHEALEIILASRMSKETISFKSLCT